MNIQDQITRDKEKLERITEKECQLHTQKNELKKKIVANEQTLLTKYKDEHIAICLDALIVGAAGLQVRHGEYAPYSTAYYVGGPNNIVKDGFCRTVYSTRFEELPTALYNYLIKCEWKHHDFLELKEKTDEKWASLPSCYTPDFYKTKDNAYLHDHHIANGYETDGFDNIVAGRLGGTYSSWTTGSQNDLSRELIALKGYCTEYYLAKFPKKIPLFEQVFKRHGLDSDFSDLNAWAKRNPTRCMSNNKYYKTDV